jgi:hypothetical protein
MAVVETRRFEPLTPCVQIRFVLLVLRYSGVEEGTSMRTILLPGEPRPVMKARDFDDALEIANGTEYGLTGSVFSRDGCWL